MLAPGVLEVGIDDLEGAREREAEAARDLGQAGLGLRAIGEAERRQSGQMLQDGPELELLVELSELVNALLQPLGDRQVERVDDVAAVGLRRRLSADQEVVDLAVEEVAVALEVLLVDVQTGRLELNNGGTGNGAFTLSATTTLDFGGGTHTLQAGSSISAANGTVSFSGGTTTVSSGSLAIATTAGITGGTVLVDGTGTFGTAATTAITNDGGTLTQDAGTLQVLLNRLNNERLPVALELKKKVDRGERLTDHDMQFLSKVFADAGDARRLVEKHPEMQALVAKLTSLYSEITRKALENEQKPTGA